MLGCSHVCTGIAQELVPTTGMNDIHCSNRGQAQAANPATGVVEEGFVEEVTPKLSYRTNSSDPWENGI